MGTVREGDTKFRDYTRRATSSATGHLEAPVVKHLISTRNQTGYRSGPLSKEEIAAIERVDSLGKRSDIGVQLQALERIEKATTNTPWRNVDPFVVNDRDYSEWSTPLTSVSYRTPEVVWTPGRNQASGNFLVGLDSCRVPPTFHDVESLRGEASKLMRRMTPTRPDWDLTRFIIELKDVNRIFATAASLPDTLRPLVSQSSRSDARIGRDFAVQSGATYLGYQFGVAPTVSDVMKGAEAIVKADEKFGQFVRDSAMHVKRSSSLDLLHFTDSLSQNELFSSFGSDPSRSVVRLPGGSRLGRVDYLRPDPIAVNIDARVGYSVSVKERLVAFATFEYFVGDPDGYLSRMDQYVAKAKKTLGSGLTASVLYEVAPWSWMIDWHLDIGGLLNYQQSVADYGTVARGAGFSLFRDTVASRSLSPIRPVNNPISGTGILNTAHVSYKVREHFRRSGSPYSMDLNWDYGTFQWSILGALGLTKAPRVPNRR